MRSSPFGHSVRSALAAAFLVPAATTSVAAAVLHVPSDYPTIAAAVLAVGRSDTVSIACGTYFEHDLLLSGLMSAFTLLGEGTDPSCVVIDAGGAQTALWIYTVGGFVARGVTFRGASTIAVQVDEANVITIDDCLFRDNHGGISAGASLFLSDCSFQGNSDVAVYAVGNFLGVAGCDFDHNGTAVLAYSLTGGSNVNCTRSVFRENSGPSIYAGGGRGPSQVDLRSCTFYGEAAGLHVDHGMTLTIQNCIFARGGGLCSGALATYVSCTDSYGNAGGDWPSCLTSAYGNFSADPAFCDPTAGDLSLREDSPCAAANNPCSLVGALDVGCGAVSVAPQSWGRTKSLYR